MMYLYNWPSFLRKNIITKKLKVKLSSNENMKKIA